jgi:hypothetical protein
MAPTPTQRRVALLGRILVEHSDDDDVVKRVIALLRNFPAYVATADLLQDLIDRPDVKVRRIGSQLAQAGESTDVERPPAS